MNRHDTCPTEPRRPEDAISALIHRRRRNPISMEAAAIEIGRAIVAAYLPALEEETVVVGRSQIIALPEGTYRRLLRAVRRGVRSTRGRLPSN